jgi:KDO2-lipid IV(A) lauroyltransferase
MCIETEYLEKVKELQIKWLDNTSTFGENSSRVLERSVMSANLFHLIPNLPVSDYDKTISRITMFQKWSYLDQSYPHLVHDVTVDGLVPNFMDIQEKPVIFCSYHLGSYRLIINYLASTGVKITLLIDENVSKAQSKDFFDVVANVQRQCDLSDDFRIVDTAAPNMLMTLMRDLKEKRCLFVFLDGNKGVGGRSINKDKLLQIDFLDMTLNVRKGVAFLSYISGVPLLPLSAKRMSENFLENIIKFYPQIFPDMADTRDSYIKMAIQKMYCHLASELTEFYEQWECWRYIDQALVVPKQDEHTLTEMFNLGRPLRFNKCRYLIFSPPNETFHVLFDRKYYLTTVIGTAFYEVLHSIQDIPQAVSDFLKREGVTSELLSELLRKEILNCDNIEETVQ